METTVTFYCPRCGGGRYVSPAIRSVRCRKCKALTLFVRCRGCGRVSDAGRYGRHRCPQCGERTLLRESNQSAAATVADWVAQTTSGLDPARGDQLLRNLQVLDSPSAELPSGQWVWLAVSPGQLRLGIEHRDGVEGRDGETQGATLALPFGEIKSVAIDGAPAGITGDTWAWGAEPTNPLGSVDPSGGTEPEGRRTKPVRWAPIEIDTTEGRIALRAGNLTVGLARAVFEPLRSELASREPVADEPHSPASPAAAGEPRRQGGQPRTSRAGAAARPLAGAELVSALERLDELHRSGALDEDEFKLAKKSVLEEAEREAL